MMIIRDKIIIDVLRLQSPLGIVSFLDVFVDVEVGEQTQHDDHVDPQEHLAPHRKCALPPHGLNQPNRRVRECDDKLDLNRIVKIK